MVFLANDREIVSSSEDGCVYQWEVGVNARSFEFIMKRAVCTLLCVSPAGTLFAYLDDVINPSASQKLTKRASQYKSKANVGAGAAADRRLCIFEGSLKSAADQVIDVPFVGVTAMCSLLGKASNSEALAPGVLLVLGYEDGSVLISGIPLPLRRVQSFRSFNSMLSLGNDDIGVTEIAVSEDEAESEFLSLDSIDTLQCKVVHDHRGAVTTLRASNCGNWIFSGGSDGSLFMYSTSYRAANSTFNMDAGCMENGLIMTELNTLKSLQIDTKNKDDYISNIVSGFKKEIEELTLKKDEIIDDLRDTLHREVSKRDKIIISERDDHIKSIGILHQETRDADNAGKKRVAELEYEYEKKMAAESLYTFQSAYAIDILGTQYI